MQRFFCQPDLPQIAVSPSVPEGAPICCVSLLSSWEEAEAWWLIHWLCWLIFHVIHLPGGTSFSFTCTSTSQHTPNQTPETYPFFLDPQRWPSLLQFTGHENSCPPSILLHIYGVSVVADLLLSLVTWQLVCNLAFCYPVSLIWLICADVFRRSLLQLFPGENLQSFFQFIPESLVMRHGEAVGRALLKQSWSHSCSLLAFLALIVWWHWCSRGFKDNRKWKEKGDDEVIHSVPFQYWCGFLCPPTPHPKDRHDTVLLKKKPQMLLEEMEPLDCRARRGPGWRGRPVWWWDLRQWVGVVEGVFGGEGRHSSLGWNWCNAPGRKKKEEKQS